MLHISLPRIQRHLFIAEHRCCSTLPLTIAAHYCRSPFLLTIAPQSCVARWGLEKWSSAKWSLTNWRFPRQNLWNIIHLHIIGVLKEVLYSSACKIDGLLSLLYITRMIAMGLIWISRILQLHQKKLLILLFIRVCITGDRINGLSAGNSVA